MMQGELVKVTSALYRMAKAEEEFSTIDYIKNEESLEAINNLHIAMNALARVILDDTHRSIKLHESVKKKGLT